MLANDPAGGEVSDQKLVEIGIGRILPDTLPAQVLPILEASKTLALIEFADHGEVELRIVLEPFHKQEDDVVTHDPGRRGVR